MSGSRSMLVAVVILLSALVLMAGCGQPTAEQAAPGEEAPPPLTGEPYVIGAMFAVTGDASSLGIPERNTAQMLERIVNESGGINGHPLQIVIEDTRGAQPDAQSAAQRLVERDDVLAIVGPSRTGTTMAVIDYVERVEVPLVSCAAGIAIVEPPRDWVFKTPQTDRMAVQKIIEYLQQQNITRVASLSDNTPFGKGGLREIQSLMPAAGIEVVATEEYGPTDTSMTTQLTKMGGTNAQAVVCWGTPPGPARVASNMQQLGMDIPLICSHGVANQRFLDLAGEAANGVVLPAGRLIVLNQIPADHPQRAVLQQYSQAYQDEFDQSADTFGGHSWDAIQIVVQALRQVGPDRAALRDAIEQTNGFVGTGGVFNFSPEDHNGLTKDAFVMVEVVDGHWTLVE